MLAGDLTSNACYEMRIFPLRCADELMAADFALLAQAAILQPPVGGDVMCQERAAHMYSIVHEFLSSI